MASMPALTPNVEKLFSFFQLCGNLKVICFLNSACWSSQLFCIHHLQHLRRTGWVNNDVKDPETVAGHMYRMAMMCMVFGTQDTAQQVDREK